MDVVAGNGGPSPPAVTPVFVADLLAEGERMPVFVHVIDHPDARVLVDTGMTELHPAAAEHGSPSHASERAGLRPRGHRHGDPRRLRATDS